MSAFACARFKGSRPAWSSSEKVKRIRAAEEATGGVGQVRRDTQFIVNAENALQVYIISPLAYLPLSIRVYCLSDAGVSLPRLGEGHKLHKGVLV